MKVITSLAILGISLLMASCVTNRSVTSAPKISAMEQSLLNQGLVDVQRIDSTIDVQIVYSTCHNFMGRKIYTDLNKAFLRDIAAQKLKLAHKYLREERMDVHFVVYDAARPVSIQRDLWKMVEGTDKEDYVSNPAKGKGMHNYGLAVDLTIADCTGQPLPMGSEYDFFGDRARVDVEEELLKSGKITQREYENRQLLRRVMTKAGFQVFNSEWWHFNAVDPNVVAQQYTIIE